jgi:hypothetical protein
MRRVLFGVQLVALAVVLAGCGGDALSLDPVADAATKTANSGSSRVEFAVAMKFSGESIDMNGSGAFDYRHSRGSLTYHLELPELGDVRVDLRMVGTKMFIRMPAVLGNGLTNGKEWLGLDLGKSLEQAGLGSFDFTRQQDPAQSLRYLRAASTDVREAGSARVKGVETTRYLGRLDFRKALAVGLDELGMSAAEQEKARRGMETMLTQLGSDSLPFEVFVDGDGLLRRMKMDLSMTIAGERLAMAMQMDYFDFGVDVHVQAPPARSVLDVSGLPAQQG